MARLIALCLLLATSLCGQTTGVSGVQDFTLNGQGSGGTSPVGVTVLQGFNTLLFQVSAAPGSLLVGAVGSSAPGAFGVGTFTLDVFPFSIWLDAAALPGFPVGLTTVPPSGVWSLSVTANVVAGTNASFQFAVLNAGFAGGIGLTQAITLQETPNLPNCVIDFDGACPNIASQCGATFTGGDGCFFAGLAFCYSSGIRSYRVTTVAPLTISLAGDVNTLNVFFANQDALSAGTMTFKDASGVPVTVTTALGAPQPNPIASVGACALAMPAGFNLAFATPVRSVDVVATAGTLWIDDFHINP